MTKEQQQIYESYFDLFASKGWKHYIKTVSEDREKLLITGVYESKSELELGKAQGAIHYLDIILQLEDTIQNMYEEAQKDHENDGNYVRKIEDGE